MWHYRYVQRRLIGQASFTERGSVSRGIRLVDMGAGGREPRRCSVAARCVSLDAPRDKAQTVYPSGATASEVVWRAALLGGAARKAV